MNETSQGKPSQISQQDASYLLKDRDGRYPIGELEVKPGEQSHISLGVFRNITPLKGFSIHLTPNPQEDAIVTHVAHIDIDHETYELMLNIANYGNKIISAEIRQL